MSTTIIRDSRSSKGSLSGSRQRFLKRNKQHIKRAVEKSFEQGGITHAGEGGVDVTLPKKGVSEPHIVHSNTGRRGMVHPGNKKFNTGDLLPRPPSGEGNGRGKASDQGGGEDDFTFHLSEKEFYDFLFEGLELPNFDKKGQQKSDKTQSSRSGIVSEGTPNNLDLVRSSKKRIGRRLAQGKNNPRILELYEKKLSILNKYNKTALASFSSFVDRDSLTKGVLIKKIDRHINNLVEQFGASMRNDFYGDTTEQNNELEALQKSNRRLSMWNDVDLQYRNFSQKPIYTSKAVMFCVMDVSGSMDQETKNNAKLFYILLHKFLQKHYEQTDVVFIRHHTQAEEVDEQEFFYGHETGGTIVSSGLKKMLQVIKDRYPSDQWNIYGAQASDGDNWESDSEYCIPLMEDILSLSQGYFYTEITYGEEQELWSTYAEIAARHQDKFWMGHIEERQDIPRVFREFFQKREEKLSVNSYAPPSFS